MNFRLRDDESIPGRGTWWNPDNRFEDRSAAYEGEDAPEGPARVPTTYLEDASQTIIARNSSPDVGFDVSINPYRGCEHGCVYCYARPTHEYMGYSAGLDFESVIFYKPRAAELLERELSKRSWKPEVIAMSGVTDPYQPVEREMKLARGCLEVLAKFRNPVGIVTKNRLVCRDIDILAEMAADGCAGVMISLTTLDLALNRILEPRTSSPAQRLEAISRLSQAGIPVGVLVAPVIPAITDHEIPALLQAARDAGARHAGYVMLRLPHAVAPLFDAWLAEHFPDRKDKVLHRIQSMRGGALYSAEFGTRMRGTGIHADQVAHLFQVFCKRLGFQPGAWDLRTDHFRPAGGAQLELGF
ncbi:MAG: PA0069 family radical SAM protein [Candidatus Hydrogenedentes bacterium]|nr:PA0069 family radical SAM protein [Candidatus Hydrogenedentota bacterium]